jgi:hypothetical protein
MDWAAGRVGRVNRGAALELCRQFGFRRLADRIAGMSAADAPPSWQADYRTVT